MLPVRKLFRNEIHLIFQANVGFEFKQLWIYYLYLHTFIYIIYQILLRNENKLILRKQKFKFYENLQRSTNTTAIPLVE